MRPRCVSVCVDHAVTLVEYEILMEEKERGREFISFSSCLLSNIQKDHYTYYVNKKISIT